jgi:hypothetical protein
MIYSPQAIFVHFRIRAANDTLVSNVKQISWLWIRRLDFPEDLRAFLLLHQLGVAMDCRSPVAEILCKLRLDKSIAHRCTTGLSPAFAVTFDNRIFRATLRRLRMVAISWISTPAIRRWRRRKISA